MKRSTENKPCAQNINRAPNIVCQLWQLWNLWNGKKEKWEAQ